MNGKAPDRTKATPLPFHIDPSADDGSDAEREEGLALIRRLEQAKGLSCASCGRQLCAHQTLASIALGLGNTPRCLNCMAASLEQSAEELAGSLFNYFQRRTCYRTAWDWASKEEAVGSEGIPKCFLD
jgi:hypothetical protein